MKNKKKFMILWVLLIAVLFAGSLLTAPPGKTETIQTAMRDAVLHEENQISLFGWKNVNPGLISAMTVSAILLIAAACIRVFVIPKFKVVPGRFQLLLEQAVSLFDGMAKTSSPQRNGFLGAYIFGAGAYIFVGTLFELLGLQTVTTTGRSVTLPAPLSDVNGAIALGCLSYLVILSGGIAGNGLKGVGKTLKEFSLPISMSFRLFGALLSGLLVEALHNGCHDRIRVLYGPAAGPAPGGRTPALLLCGRLDFHGRHLRDSYQVPVCVGLLANDINIADGSPHVHYCRQPDCGEQHR